MIVARQLLELFRVKHLAQLAITLALFTGCSGTAMRSASQSETKLYAVTTDNAAFFRYGPQQGSGPDRALPRNTLVRLIRASWGYSKIQVVDDKQQGYVASEDISAAPASLVAAANTQPTPPPNAEQFDLNSTDPRLNAPQENLPPPDLPPAPDMPPAPDAAAAPSPADH
jgi:hypothetical protein